MITINGKESKHETHQFTNLEEMLIASFNDCTESKQIITDIVLNNETFSEIYPHQAEDISASQVNSLEIHAVAVNTMALDITVELFKVTESMGIATLQTAEHFRKGDDYQALELLQNLIDVNRDFLNVLGALRTDFEVPNDHNLDATSEKYSELLSELLDVMEDEDWILLADFLEFEIHPACVEWNTSLEFVKLHFQNVETSSVTQ